MQVQPESSTYVLHSTYACIHAQTNPFATVIYVTDNGALVQVPRSGGDFRPWENSCNLGFHQTLYPEADVFSGIDACMHVHMYTPANFLRLCVRPFVSLLSRENTKVHVCMYVERARTVWSPVRRTCTYGMVTVCRTNTYGMTMVIIFAFAARLI